MKKKYKGYEIDISSKEKSGQWAAKATKTPVISGMRGMTIIGTGRAGFKTQAEAEAATLKWVEDWHR